MNTGTRSIPLSGRTAVITGGASGVGWATTKRLLDEGVQVLVADRSPLHESHPNLLVVRADIAEGAGTDEVQEMAVDAFCVPDILVATAGDESAIAGDPASFGRAGEVNLFGAFRLARVFAPRMAQRGTGDLVFLSSTALRRPCAPKAGLELAIEMLRMEFEGSIRTTVLWHGAVSPDLSGKPNDRSRQTGGTAKTIGSGDIADAIVYALSRPAHIALNECVIGSGSHAF
jgi:NAD(P)-dependent dehydrogenase (short-subunit alcohol dehydrogenase family)